MPQLDICVTSSFELCVRTDVWAWFGDLIWKMIEANLASLSVCSTHPSKINCFDHEIDNIGKLLLPRIYENVLVTTGFYVCRFSHRFFLKLSLVWMKTKEKFKEIIFHCLFECNDLCTPYSKITFSYYRFLPKKDRYSYFINLWDHYKIQ